MPASDVTFQWDTAKRCMGEGVEDLLVAHWQEVEHFQQEIPLAIDWPKVLMLERVGIYKAITARKAGRLIGYAGFFVQPSLHHRHTVWAVNNALYLDKSQRRGNLGRNLIEAAERLLKEAGAFVLTIEDRDTDENSTDVKPHATLGDLLTRGGYSLAGKVYAKIL